MSFRYLLAREQAGFSHFQFNQGAQLVFVREGRKVGVVNLHNDHNSPQAEERPCVVLGEGYRGEQAKE